MEIIFKSFLEGYFVAGGEMYICGHYDVYNEGGFIYIKHKQINSFVYWKQPFEQIANEAEETFATVELCVAYLQTVIS